jgi:hypothetical protein
MTKKERQLRDELEMIDWDEVWSRLDGPWNEYRSPLDDERDTYLAKVREEEGWEAYCRLVNAEMEFTIHLCRGGYLL